MSSALEGKPRKCRSAVFAAESALAPRAAELLRGRARDLRTFNRLSYRFLPKFEA
jgi:hypothetical protein